ncbi:uncharacterized protein LOC118644656 [Monomorium pharaonis]|uniref:uncharacterized protein LOC118644656 n=1 Tax=Monomorium pharaonis TaxID=307658 RepID=UPI0017472C22|nr:uncharacterized protein LOC118644656 [Monomorium pharaonis]
MGLQGERPVAQVNPFRTQYGRLSLRRRREAEVAEETVPARRRRIGEAPVAIVAPAVAAAALPLPPPPPSLPSRVIPVVDLVSVRQEERENGWMEEDRVLAEWEEGEIERNFEERENGWMEEDSMDRALAEWEEGVLERNFEERDNEREMEEEEEEEVKIICYLLVGEIETMNVSSIEEESEHGGEEERESAIEEDEGTQEREEEEKEEERGDATVTPSVQTGGGVVRTVDEDEATLSGNEAEEGVNENSGVILVQPSQQQQEQQHQHRRQSQNSELKCGKCKRSFFGQACYNRHREVNSYDSKSHASVCDSVKVCDGCGRFVKSGTEHKCDETYCKTCRSLHPSNHQCYMQPLRRKTVIKDPGEGTSTGKRVEVVRNKDNDELTNSHSKGLVAFVFYDFETRQDELLQGSEDTYHHVPTLCVAHQVCEACSALEEDATRCRWCGIREFVFRDDPVKQFVDFVTRLTKCFKKIICIAHNAKAFHIKDAQFILKYLVEKTEMTEKPELILNGTKIIAITLGHVKFIDSVNYMPMRLSELPKAFGLRDTSDKGVFPHLFNTIENQTYVGPLPDIQYFCPDQMKPEEREQFLAWHSKLSNEGYIFDFQREIVRYCRNDVVILRRACMEFRKIFLERGDVCPFEECTTIASTCMKVFRKNFLRSDEIGVIPSKGYRNADKQSQKALRWLVWMERELGHPVIHAGRGREHVIAGATVDGYYETETANETRRYVLQFHGCFWHGCPSCFRVNRDRTLLSANPEDTIDTRYERTLARTWRLQRLEYCVTEKWECDFDREVRENREMHTYFENHALLKLAPLNPREAFYGGRTENIAIHYEVKGTEKMRYVDIGEECGRLIGTAPNFNFDNVEGLVRCKVLPPRDLYHPVLPYRVNGKLIFGLCRSCCETFSTLPCTHDSPSDREFEGTWVSCELRKAVEKGYFVTEVSEIWQYNVTRYDPGTRQGGLFAEYINTFLQLKQEASGWPSECQDDEAKERYLREYEKTEGIVLEKNNIARNSGIRSVAKLCLNSFWGKFDQRANLPKTEIVKTFHHFATLLTSPEHEITGILPVNDEVMYVSWRLREEAVVASPITNVVIAAYTTAQARLVLYSYLEKLDKRALYCDTDWCIYLSSGVPNEYEPRTGNFLGDMTDELESYGSGSFIESFVSGGPKFYAYVVRTPQGNTHEKKRKKRQREGMAW